MYAQKSFKDRLTAFDVYKQLPKGYLQPTFVGAICKEILILFNTYSNCFNYNNVDIFI
jgi:hypothetical protein